MVDIAHFLLGPHIQYSSVQDYIRATGMDRAKTWGTDIEMLTIAHLLKTPVLCYVTEQSFWHRYIPRHVDRTLNDDMTQMAMYLNHPRFHFEVVFSTKVTVFVTDACSSLLSIHRYVCDRISRVHTTIVAKQVWLDEAVHLGS